MARRSTHTRWRAALIGLVAVAAMVAAACTSDSDAASSDTTEVADGGAALTLADVEASTGDLNDIVKQAMSDTGIPGVSVAVVFDDQVVYTQGYGVKEEGTSQPVDAATVFQLASVSKPVGSTVVAGLVGDGELEWTDTMQSLDPSFELDDPYVSENVTVADLYSHRSGLPGFTGNDLEYMGFDQATIFERMRYIPLTPFRATYSYSNFGMSAAGVAAAGAAGMDFATAADEVLFDPAGMTHSSFRNADFQAQSNKALIHAKLGGKWVAEFQRQADPQAPAGGVSSNAEDMATWMRLQLGNGTLDGKEIIDEDALGDTHRPMINNRPTTDPNQPASSYGLGWDVGQSEVDNQYVQFGHSGAFSVGAATVVKLYPQLGLGVTILTNAQPIGVAEAMVDSYVDQLLHGEQTQDWMSVWQTRFAPVLAAPEYPEVTSPEPARDLDAYVGTYSNDYFGDVRVVAVGDALQLQVGPTGATTWPVEHYDGDEFLYIDSPEIEGAKSPLAFEFTGDGDRPATTLLLGTFDLAEGGPWMELQRVG